MVFDDGERDGWDRATMRQGVVLDHLEGRNDYVPRSDGQGRE
jgi:hypothetical protein